MASFDVGDEDEENSAGANIESAIETLRNMDQDGNILPLRCYLTYKDTEIQVLSDKELVRIVTFLLHFILHSMKIPSYFDYCYLAIG